MATPIQPPPNDLGTNYNVYMYDRHAEILDVVAKRIGTRTTSAALRFIIEDWARLSNYNEWSKKEQPA